MIQEIGKTIIGVSVIGLVGAGIMLLDMLYIKLKKSIAKLFMKLRISRWHDRICFVYKKITDGFVFIMAIVFLVIVICGGISVAYLIGNSILKTI
jgi:hypothetical protein